MTKAKEAALKAYPDKEMNGIAMLFGEQRRLFQEGYEQAEKDLALTWEDIKAIITIGDSMLTGTAWDVIDWPDEQKYYEEVLKRFKDAKK